MQDRFKFRAWLIDEKRYGENINLFNCCNDTIYDVEEYDNKGSHYTMYEADEVVLEQATGLKDKNGKLIYEGDILEVKVFDKKNYNQKKQTYWTVEWHEHRNNYGFMVYGINRRWNAPVTINKLFNAEAVVVGNIHENPDLLGDKTDE